MFRKFWTLKVLWIINSAFLVLLGGVLLFGFWGLPRIISNQLHQQLELEKGTEQWDRFVDLPFALNYTIRFWTVQNPYDIINLNQTPVLEESKPYNYFLHIKKKNITTNDSDDTVTYERELSFEFDNSTDARETDVVTILNPVILSSLQLTNTVERLAWSGCVEKLYKRTETDQIFINKTVRDLLFDGIIFAENDESVGVACSIVRERIIKLVENIRPLEYIEENNGTRSYIRFSFFNYKTGSYQKPRTDGIYTISRGRDDLSLLGNILLYNGDSHLPTWGNSMSTNNETCNRVRGTDSTIFSPNRKEGDTLDNFNSDICRIVNIKFVSSEESYLGINAYRYEATNTTFRPETSNPENDCFCSKSVTNINHDEDCYLDGLFDFKQCLGAPVLVSFPHFLYADEKYLNGVKNLLPDPEKHKIFLLIEPNTGTPLQGRKRIQLNSILRREPLIPQTPENMTEAVFPLLWIEEGFDLPEEYVDKLKRQYFDKVNLATGVKFGSIAVSSALLTISTFFLARKLFIRTRPSHKTK